jgi:predicted O-methyltransferase YrrM
MSYLFEKEKVPQHIHSAAAVAKGILGHITEKEVMFLSVLPLISTRGEILEIGSYAGKSTVILALSARFANCGKIHSCDPFLLESITDPDDGQKEQVEELFHENLKKYQVEDIVDFHKMKSDDLAKQWKFPIKILWIDGDHTYDSVKKDFDHFIRYCVPGSIVCLHDVLHAFDGPIRIFTEQILLSSDFGDCGIIGSLGWAQYKGFDKISREQWKVKLGLYSKLTRIVPLIVKKNNQIKINKLIYNILRTRIPHKMVDLLHWLEKRTDS